MKVLGIDYGDTDAHCVLLDVCDGFMLAFSVGLPSPSPTNQQQFVRWFGHIVAECQVNVLYIEDARYNQKALRIQTLLIAAVTQPVHLVNVGTWRKTLFDRGRITKEEAMEYVIEDSGWHPNHHHYADAYCVAKYGQMMEEV